MFVQDIFQFGMILVFFEIFLIKNTIFVTCKPNINQIHMKKTLLILVAATWSLLPTSCKKDSTNTTDNGGGGNAAQTCLVTVLDDGSIVYDAQNRITSLKSEGQSATYTYSGNKAIVAIIGDSMTINAEYTLNTSNYPTSGKFVTSYMGIPITINFTYTYDSEGHCTKSKQSLAFFGQEMNSIVDYEYTNGNLTKETAYDEASPEEKDVTTYTYFTDKSDSRALSMSKTYVIDVQGKGSKNLIKQSVTLDTEGNETVVNYTYEYDSTGKVTKETQKDEDSGEEVSLTTYGYTCK
jgi:hypothetical protein